MRSVLFLEEIFVAQRFVAEALVDDLLQLVRHAIAALVGQLRHGDEAIDLKFAKNKLLNLIIKN